MTRQDLMDRVLEASEVKSIEPLLRKTMKEIVENGTHPYLVKRFIERFESDLVFQLHQPHTKKEESNLKEAYRVIHAD